jgi:hypothetical protein
VGDNGGSEAASAHTIIKPPCFVADTVDDGRVRVRDDNHIFTEFGVSELANTERFDDVHYLTSVVTQRGRVPSRGNPRSVCAAGLELLIAAAVSAHSSTHKRLRANVFARTLASLAVRKGVVDVCALAVALRVRLQVRPGGSLSRKDGICRVPSACLCALMGARPQEVDEADRLRVQYKSGAHPSCIERGHKD